MASTKGQVTLRGRFPAGARVELVKVRDESVLRSQGGRVVSRKQVDGGGTVTFTEGVEVGARYFVVGRVRGALVEVRVRGNKPGEDSSQTFQAPIGTERVKLSDGSFADEVPEAREAVGLEAAPHLAQEQVPDGVVQRSSTPRGQATPVDTAEQVPHGRQEDVPKGVVQRSDTPHGQATPIDVGPQSQEDVPDGVVQRSATPRGVATPLPSGGPVKAQLEKESAVGKDVRGEPGKVAAAPLDVREPKVPAKRKAAAKKRAAKKG